ncbi:hypothetical protein H6G06_15795 [Anabaena sphaerica FACHB-251]|uniref:Uncharacterized protein n=1 Tax=Anabaena sphaerica FACHB-251 TaxID=2692883 RepID=A0A927A1Q0_9NOST|nr:hypothetical protein [Anabaena sphaerica]MBD2294904.1 hypothetical protein [Anabaena sphaerica FACHB-251]
MNQQSRNNKKIKLENLKKITSNGFNIEKASDKSVDLAFLSLKIALEAYFSTYHCYGGQFHLITDDSYKDLPDFLTYGDIVGVLVLSKYCEAYTECIIHFHHFAELVLKNFLRNENPLFVVSKSNEKDIVLKHKINKNSLSFEDEKDLKTITFSESLTTLVSLIENTSDDYYNKISFILANREVLETLNDLRNIIWHRGLYILNYAALDEFIGRYILPFVDEVTKHETYSGHKNLWNHKEIHCKIDPIAEIINHFEEVKEGGDYNIEKVAFLKELGRAAYNDNISYFQSQSLIENKALIVSQNDYNYDSEICICPVCGVNSLIIYKCVDYEVDQDNVVYSETSYPIRVKCECCSFELHHEIGNASEYGIEGIRDFWV